MATEGEKVGVDGVELSGLGSGTHIRHNGQVKDFVTFHTSSSYSLAMEGWDIGFLEHKYYDAGKMQYVSIAFPSIVIPEY